MKAHLTFATLVALTVLSGCATTPEADNTPLLPSATITAEIRNSGVKGMLANDAVEVTRTLADMQRVDQSFKYTGSIMGKIGAKRDRSEIMRVDKNLRWQLDNRNKRYQECPLEGCRGVLADYQASLYAEEEPEADDSCKVQMVENNFSIKPTGQQRDINGWPSNEYKLDWTMKFKDDAGKVGNNIISSTVWTTSATGDIAEAIRMQETFTTNYDKAIQKKYPESVNKAIPSDAMTLLVKHLIETLSEQDKNALYHMMQNVMPVRGFPVSTKIEWTARNETCQQIEQPQEEKEDRLDTRSFKGFLASVGKQVVKQEVDKKMEEKKNEFEMAPVFHYVREVKSIELADVRESKLSVPANYKLDNRR